MDLGVSCFSCLYGENPNELGSNLRRCAIGLEAGEMPEPACKINFQTV